MCGRFTLSASAEAIARLFEVDAAPAESLGPRYNIAPTQPVLAVRARALATSTVTVDGDEDAPPGDDEAVARELAILRWGLIPSWAKDIGIGSRMINARSETAADKPAFRAAFKRRRCLVPADGFYEWRKMNGGKQPYHIHMADGGLFGIAGLWEQWESPEGEVIQSCTLLTTEANARVQPLHDRMPVILPPEDWPLWLDPEVEHAEILQPLLGPFDPEAMDAHPVSTYVNSPRNEGADCIEPVDLGDADAEQQRLL